MKKFFLLAVILPFLTVSCGNDDDKNDVGTPDSISLIPSVEIDTQNVGTRATSTDYKTYSVILEGPGGPKTIDFPSSGQIDNLVSGQYTVTLTSHPDGFSPAFGEPVYRGSTTVNVSAGKSEKADIVCKQANAGILFDYSDPSLAQAGLTDLVPTVTMDSEALVYSGQNHGATGYFNPGRATITLKNGEENVSLNNQIDAVLELRAQQIRTVTLKAVNARSAIVNDVTIIVSFN